MEELQLIVALVPDEDDPRIFRAMSPGLPGYISAYESPQSALSSAKAALESLLSSMEPAERRTLVDQQRQVQPRDLPAGSRVERVALQVRPRTRVVMATG